MRSANRYFLRSHEEKKGQITVAGASVPSPVYQNPLVHPPSEQCERPGEESAYTPAALPAFEIGFWDVVYYAGWFVTFVLGWICLMMTLKAWKYGLIEDILNRIFR